MAAFHLGMELSLADRQRFILVLCERLGVQPGSHLLEMPRRRGFCNKQNIGTQLRGSS